MNPAVACFYTELYAQTLFSLQEFAPQARYIHTDSHDPYAYRDAVKQFWTGERDLVIVEHDIEVTDQFQDFIKCPEYWCTHYYQGFPSTGYLYRSMGCVKFSARLQRDHPFESFDHGRMTWIDVDTVIGEHLADYVPHSHGFLNHYHKPLDLPENMVAWSMCLQSDGSYLPVCKELQIDGKTIELHEVDPATGARGRWVRTLPFGYPFEARLEIFV